MKGASPMPHPELPPGRLLGYLKDGTPVIVTREPDEETFRRGVAAILAIPRRARKAAESDAAETQRDLAERLTSLERSLPLSAPESWRHEPKPARENHGPLTRNGQPTARMRREA